MSEQDWRIICPPKNWSDPLKATEAEVSLAVTIAERLDLVMTKDEARRKLYLGPRGAYEAIADALRYPSGWEAQIFWDEDAGPEYRCVEPGIAAPLIAAFPDAQLSQHFKLSDFRPGRHTHQYIRVSPELVMALEQIVLHLGQPVTVLSGYRPPDYNREAGGTSNSTHMDGLAADISCDDVPLEKLHEVCLEVIGVRGGVGLYQKNNYVHVDLRGFEARWFGA